MDGVIRRREMVESGGSTGASLLDQGTFAHDVYSVTINGRTFDTEYTSWTTDSYNKHRYCNITDFSANEVTGLDNTTDISNKHSGRIIPAGATCVLSCSDVTGKVQASYQYIAILLRDTGSGNIARIGVYGNNKPSGTATFTPSADTEIGCVAIDYTRWRGPRSNSWCNATISLTVNGEEWF